MHQASTFPCSLCLVHTREIAKQTTNAKEKIEMQEKSRAKCVNEYFWEFPEMETLKTMEECYQKYNFGDNNHNNPRPREEDMSNQSFQGRGWV